jgi:hypothetical protein
LAVAGTGEGIRLEGQIHLPDEIQGGSFTYDFFTALGSDAVFVRTTVNYPYTPELVSISTENSSLGRYTDMKTRLAEAREVKRRVPECKIVFLCDENSAPELAGQVVQAKKDGRIDGFFYSSVGLEYLVAALTAM